MSRSIEIRPNRSLSPSGARWFFAAQAAGSLTVAIGFAKLGFWPVLPFAGAELCLLALALAFTLRASRRRELIHIGGESLVVERRPDSSGARVEFPRPWVRVDLQQPHLRCHPSRLLVRHRSQVCEVGRCLTDEQRQRLYARLGEILRTGGVTARL